MLTRRTVLKSSVSALALAACATARLCADEETAAPDPREDRITLNTATIIYKNLPIDEQIRLAHEAGFRNIEIWFRDVDRFLASGGTLAALKTQLDDCGMRVVGGINFIAWGHPEEEVRQKALDEMRRAMEQMKALGGSALAASPSGIYNKPGIPLADIAERYRAVLELGDQFEITPQLEIWGAGPTLMKLSDAVWITTEAAHPRASLLLDVYHLYRGGNDFASLRQLNGRQLPNFHWNDWPGGRERLTLQDSDRVLPGEGVAPLKEVSALLDEIGFSGTYSLEIFNKPFCENHDTPELLKLAYDAMKKNI